MTLVLYCSSFILICISPIQTSLIIYNVHLKWGKKRKKKPPQMVPLLPVFNRRVVEPLHASILTLADIRTKHSQNILRGINVLNNGNIPTYQTYSYLELVC